MKLQYLFFASIMSVLWCGAEAAICTDFDDNFDIIKYECGTKAENKTVKQEKNTEPNNFGTSTKGYISFNINYVREQLNDEFGEAFSYPSGYDVDTDELVNPNNFGFNISAGIQFNQGFGLEVFLQHTFDSSAEIDFYDTTGTTLVSKYKSKVSSWAFGVDALGYIPVTDTKFSFIGSLGGGYYIFDGNFDIVNYVAGLKHSESDYESNVAFRIGLGGQYAFSDSWAIRGMVRYVALNYDEDEDVVKGLVDISLGAKYTF